MKQVAVYLLLVLFLAAGLSCPALADSTANYSITGTYGTGTASTALSGAGENFSMNFSLPTNPGALIGSNFVLGDDFYVYPLNITYSFGGTTTTLVDSIVAFYASTSSNQAGGFFVDFCVNPTCLDNLEQQWTFPAHSNTRQRGHPTLVPTNFVSNHQGFGIFDNTTGAFYGNSINSTINGAPVTTPEPSSLLPSGAGLAGLAPIAKSRR
jgi:hypothetical protein